ncbi:uncharacterized protein LOC117902333 [Drosophila subobscura]|uniref:uncharacterized protein LOC117902333 n=1 Tax=Drosophila subobscura TaxID=7241 RepID=UPI00155AB138|nr:uncharacterized protein LOC117902333 [Drosophila subobscura]
MKNGGRKAERELRLGQFPPKRIPKDVLNRTLEIASSLIDEFWLNKNCSCSPPANYEFYNVLNRSVTYQKLSLTRSFTMARDCKNVEKILTSNVFGESLLKKGSLPIFSEYASLSLQLDKPRLDKTENT